MMNDPIEEAIKAYNRVFQRWPDQSLADWETEQMRAAIAAYLRAEAARRNSTEGGGWCEVLAAAVLMQEDNDGER